MLGIAGIGLIMALNMNSIGPGAGMVGVVSPNNTYCTYYICSDIAEDDLKNHSLITKDDMKKLIDHYRKLYPDTDLYGCEEAFIEASNLTGLDPIFLFSLAGIESGWGTSAPHVKQGNPYSMGMYGDGKHVGYQVGDSFYEGIIAGACYIYQHYYLNGQTSLYLMNHSGDHSYCAGDSSWETQIESEMRYCYKLLEK